MLLSTTFDSKTHSPDTHNSPLSRLKKDNKKDVIYKYDDVQYSYPSSPSTSDSNIADNDLAIEVQRLKKKDVKTVKKKKDSTGCSVGVNIKLDEKFFSQRFSYSTIPASFKKWIDSGNAMKKIVKNQVDWSKRKRKLPVRSPRRISDIYTTAPFGVVFRVGVLVNSVSNNEASNNDNGKDKKDGSAAVGDLKKTETVKDTVVREYLEEDRKAINYSSKRYSLMEQRVKNKKQKLSKNDINHHFINSISTDDTDEFHDIKEDQNSNLTSYGGHQNSSQLALGGNHHYPDYPNSYYYDSYNYLDDSSNLFDYENEGKAAQRPLPPSSSGKEPKKPGRAKKPQFNPDGTPIKKLSWRDKISKKECASCKTRKTPMWRDHSDGTPYCNACGIRFKKHHTRCKDCLYIPRKEEKGRLKCPKCQKDTIAYVGK